MTIDRSFVERNQAARGRLHGLVGHLSGVELDQPVGADWTVGALLAHVAFWDRRAVALLDKWESEGVQYVTADPDVLNGALLDQWRSLPSLEARRLAFAATEEVDRRLEAASDDFLESIVASQSTFRLDRSLHRNEHADQIQRALK